MERLPNVNNLQEVEMSRTYRRKKDKAPEWVTHDYSWSRSSYTLEKIPYKGKTLKKEVSKWHSDSGWHDDSYANSPNWWVHEFMEVPFRAKTKKAVKGILKLLDYEEADVPTVYKKPYIYYW